MPLIQAPVLAANNVKYIKDNVKNVNPSPAPAMSENIAAAFKID